MRTMSFLKRNLTSFYLNQKVIAKCYHTKIYIDEKERKQYKWRGPNQTPLRRTKPKTRRP
jgi:hypothetical protein